MKFYLRCVDAIYYEKFYEEWKELFEKFNITIRTNEENKKFPFIEFNTLNELMLFLDHLKENYKCGVVIEKENIFNDGDYYTIIIYDGWIE